MDAWYKDGGFAITAWKPRMLPYLLNAVYLALLVVASPWLAWNAWQKGKYREGYAAKFWGEVPRRDSNKSCVWLHAVSVGEVNLLAPLVKEIRARHPDWDCVISTTTHTGFALARKKYAEYPVFYCPLDFSWAVRRAMRRLRPTLLVLAELELWPNLIRAAREHGAKVAIVNGRLSAHSFRGYARVKAFVRPVLAQLDLIAVQNKEYGDRFLALGAPAERMHITGSVKYDGAQTNRHNPGTQKLASLAGIGEGDLVWLAGSTQEPEEAIVLSVFQRLTAEFPRLKLILVPRHPDRFDDVARLITDSGLRWRRRSQLHPKCENGSARVLLVDAVGELGHWWGTAQVAFVGGSLGKRGGQNMIEPAAYGAAVCFGPNTRNFRDIVENLLAAQAAVVVQDAAELEAFVRRAITDAEFATRLGTSARRFVAGQLGATARTVDLLSALVPNAVQPAAVARSAA
ncbi:MAG: 3-deoxy-D-manno-octulosonic acid transferase [Planctomycetia bacterium]|nr:3-deoxy-D-manno-octulosonic acid transferase [Planctomycetia bacterium]